MASETIIFCANQNCKNLRCYRNPKHSTLNIPHTFALFSNCPRWNSNGGKK